MSHRALLIAGPTATGKSALAVSIAKAAGGEIINADSMQVYGDLEILSARPGAAAMRAVPHHLFGIAGAGEAFSVSLWHDRAAASLGDIQARGGLAILVGGTGLYFRALLAGLAPVPEIPGGIRAEVRALARDGGPAALYARLGECDPVMAERLDAGDSQRLARALEVVRATGRSLADWQQQATPGALAGADARGAVGKFVLSLPRDRLYRRIEDRFDKMLAAGALDEVARLLEQGVGADVPAMKALGVASLAAHLGGALDFEAAVRDAKTQTRRYAKRQLTWFRNQCADWCWLEADADDLGDRILAGVTE